jgi:replicative DNA helicase
VELAMRLDAGAKDTSKPFSETLGESSRELFAMESVREKSKTNTEVLNEVVDEWEWAHTNPGKIIGISSGFKSLDRITFGFQKRSLNIIGARPSTGKTALLCNLISHIAIDQGLPTLFFSLESGAKEILRRIILIRGRLDGNRLRGGNLQEGDLGAITSNVSKISKAPLIIVDDGSLTVAQIRAVARSVAREKGIQVIALDYVQKIAFPKGKSEKRAYDVGFNSSELKEMAKELDIPVIAAAQLNRESEKDKGREPRTSDLADSDQITKDADLIGLLHRLPRTDALPAHMSEIDLLIGKQRDGWTGRVPFVFQKTCTRFEQRED